MKIAFDIDKMKPACVLLQAAMGGDPEAANAFNSKHWLIAPTEGMKVYPVTDEQLRALVAKVEAKHG